LHHDPGREITRRQQQQRGADGVQLEHPLHVESGLGGNRRRHAEVGPVVVDRLIGHERVVRPRVLLGEFGGQRGMPDEVGDEVRAIEAIALAIG
jgi:hypothetical protein